MLREFVVDNYKSLINVVFAPRDMNLLLGLNNAGKTTLCQAMTFAARTVGATLNQCADGTGGGRIGLTNFFFDKSTIDFAIKADVSFEKDTLMYEYHLAFSAPVKWTPNASLQVEGERLSVTGGGFSDVLLLENSSAGVKLLHEQDYVHKHETNYVETAAPRDETMLSRLYDLQANPRANAFKQYLTSWQYYALSSPALRGPGHKPNEDILNSDGSNLASVIYNLKTTRERSYRKLLEHVRKIEPSIDLINFQVASENSVFMFFEDASGHVLPAWNASAGTLRYLALAYVLLVQPALQVSPLIIVEEPENGIYVGLLKDLISMVSSGPGAPQVVFTTHSPYFIDLFDDRLDSIFSMRRGDKNATLSQPDAQRVKARLAEFPLGEQHFREMLR